MATDFSNKVSILAELWMNYRDDDEMEDFFEYNDIGLPLAYFIHTELVKSSDDAVAYVEETFNLLCAALNVDLDGTYKNLHDMFEQPEK